ncbi:MAG: type II toxin-antitoxin system RelE/ParE family toxin [Bacteroidota bacterium]
MRKVTLSKRASVKLEKLLVYLENEWTEKVKHDFIKILDKNFDRIITYPKSNEKSALKKGLYRCVVTRQTTLFYQFDASSIKVVALFDTRMDPRKIKQEVR